MISAVATMPESLDGVTRSPFRSRPRRKPGGEGLAVALGIGIAGRAPAEPMRAGYSTAGILDRATIGGLVRFEARQVPGPARQIEREDSMEVRRDPERDLLSSLPRQNNLILLAKTVGHYPLGRGDCTRRGLELKTRR